MESLTIALLQIYCRVRNLKRYENRPAFKEVTGKIHVGRSDVTVICGHNTISMLWATRRSLVCIAATIDYLWLTSCRLFHRLVDSSTKFYDIRSGCMTMVAVVLTYYCNFDMRDSFETRRYIWLSLFIV